MLFLPTSGYSKNGVLLKPRPGKGTEPPKRRTRSRILRRVTSQDAGEAILTGGGGGGGGGKPFFGSVWNPKVSVVLSIFMFG